MSFIPAAPRPVRPTLNASWPTLSAFDERYSRPSLTPNSRGIGIVASSCPVTSSWIHGLSAGVGPPDCVCYGDIVEVQKLMGASIGTNNVDKCSRICHAPSAAGLTATVPTRRRHEPSRGH